MINWIFIALLSLYTLLSIIRIRLALAEINKQKDISSSRAICEKNITVLQPILGGDPALESCLKQNLNNAPEALFIWLLDIDDKDGIQASSNAIKACSNVTVECIINPPPPTGVNPKMWKLAKALPMVKTPFCAILDDDTILPSSTLSSAAHIADSGNLVTGLPIYDARTNFLSRLVTGFVNANSALTYLPSSYLHFSNTVNGMFTLMRSSDVTQNDFDKLSRTVTDDYALALLFKKKGLGIKQTTLLHPIITTVSSVSHYNSLMKRWFVFVRIYLRENVSVKLFFLVILPAVLPIFLLILASFINIYAVGIVGISLLIKSLLVKKIYSLLGRQLPFISDSLFEVTAELLAPLHTVWALISPSKIKWRKRRFVLDGAKIIND